MKTFSIHSLVAGSGTVISGLLGGYDMALYTLVIFMVMDYLTGILVGIRSKKLSSDVMFWGGVRKGVILCVVAISVLLDGLIGNEAPIFRTLAIYYYVSREGLSITENVALLGVPLPSFLTGVLDQLNKQAESGKAAKPKGGKK